MLILDEYVSIIAENLIIPVLNLSETKGGDPLGPSLLPDHVVLPFLVIFPLLFLIINLASPPSIRINSNLFPELNPSSYRTYFFLLSPPHL